MQIKVHNIQVHVLNMATRMPFRYGIATLTTVPHLFMRLDLEVDGHIESGVSSEGFPPKWFTKDPGATFAQEFEDMERVLHSAMHLSQQIGPATSLFEWWKSIYEGQRAWAQATAFPPLLWAFGVTMVERAAISAFCHATKTTFAEGIRRNSFGINLGRIRPELANTQPAELLPAQPRRSMIARHTIGLTDPLTDADIPESERVDDGLPQSLEACIAAYGLTHFKIKLHGDAEQDQTRLTETAEVIRQNCPRFRFTLDFNENFQDAGEFHGQWEALKSQNSLEPFWPGLLFVEQPLHRSVALAGNQRAELNKWHDRPPIIIDESDGDLQSLPEALRLGYAGTSHKNCKGVFKGILNACHLEMLRRQDTRHHLVFSGEDLCNVGPVALLQDLTVAANFGLEHVERNGHHYMAGTSMLPADIQTQILETHGDLYRSHAGGFASLNICRGMINISTLVDAPFGLGFPLDTTRFIPLDDWKFNSLEVSAHDRDR